MAILDAWSKDLGSNQGRIQPAESTPADGDYVFCLGYDQPLHTEELAPGDFCQIEQVASFTPGTKLLRVTAKVRPPSTVPAGLKWVLRVLLDDVALVEHTLQPGGHERVRTFSLNISKKAAYTCYILTIRLSLVTDDDTQYIAAASYQLGSTSDVCQAIYPSGIASAAVVVGGTVNHSDQLVPTGIPSGEAF